MKGRTEIAVGAADFSFRKHKDGGFIITQGGKLDAFLTLDHLLLGRKYLPRLCAQRDWLQISLGKYFFKDLTLGRPWNARDVFPFEKAQVQGP